MRRDLRKYPEANTDEYGIIDRNRQNDVAGRVLLTLTTPDSYQSGCKLLISSYHNTMLNSKNYLGVETTHNLPVEPDLCRKVSCTNT